MGDDRKRRQDTFVVRLWRDATSLRLLRAEVEHVQSGGHSEHHWSVSNPDNARDWIFDQMLSVGLLQPGVRSLPGADQQMGSLDAIPEHDGNRNQTSEVMKKERYPCVY